MKAIFLVRNMDANHIVFIAVYSFQLSGTHLSPIFFSRFSSQSTNLVLDRTLLLCWQLYVLYILINFMLGTGKVNVLCDILYSCNKSSPGLYTSSMYEYNSDLFWEQKNLWTLWQFWTTESCQVRHWQRRWRWHRSFSSFFFPFLFQISFPKFLDCFLSCDLCPFNVDHLTWWSDWQT